MSALRTNLEDAIVEALDPLKLEGLGGDGGYLKNVAAYNGPLDPAADDPDLLRHLERGLPLVLVTTGNGSYDNHSVRRRRAQLSLEVEILILSGNLRRAEARTRGAEHDGDPGIYQIAEDVRSALFGVELDVDGAGWALPMGESVFLRTANLSGFRMTFDVKVDAVQSVDDSDGYYEGIDTSVNNADDDTADPVVYGEREFAT